MGGMACAAEGVDPVIEVQKTSTCVGCGTEFTYTWIPGQGKPRTYCGMECRKEQHRKRMTKTARVKREVREGELTPAQRGRQKVLDRERANLEMYEKEWCGRDHKTWAVRAQCLWPEAIVQGEGPVAVWHPSWGTEIRLYATKRHVPRVTPDTRVVVMRRGPHRLRGVEA